ncbi:putative quinol monooxygenase [Methanobrevibacter sp. DSM 116169]|uniref:putative quinol monooxygenase n=1 Tax=Methanobrevibacter sp. DSM 116169 TaxID=3242727 RepID=UPI0038FC1ACB
MIIVLAKVSPKQGMKDSILEESKDLIEKTRAEKGCIEYNLFDSTDDDSSLLFVEKWENKDDLKSHLTQDHFINFGSNTKDFLAKDLEITVYSAEETEL